METRIIRINPKSKHAIVANQENRKKRKRSHTSSGINKTECWPESDVKRRQRIQNKFLFLQIREQFQLKKHNPKHEDKVWIRMHWICNVKSLPFTALCLCTDLSALFSLSVYVCVCIWGWGWSVGWNRTGITVIHSWISVQACCCSDAWWFGEWFGLWATSQFLRWRASYGAFLLRSYIFNVTSFR